MAGPLVLLAGEPEYRSDETMPAVARVLGEQLGREVVVRTSDVIEDDPRFPASSFGDLSVLSDADLLLIFTRWRVLADADMEWLSSYLSRRAPIVGLRTATHAFHFPTDSRWASWNDFGRAVLGSPWIRHHGHGSSTDVRVLPEASPALVDGLPSRFHGPGSTSRSSRTGRTLTSRATRSTPKTSRCPASWRGTASRTAGAPSAPRSAIPTTWRANRSAGCCSTPAAGRWSRGADGAAQSPRLLPMMSRCTSLEPP